MPEYPSDNLQRRRATVISWLAIILSTAAIIFFFPAEIVKITQSVARKLSVSSPPEAGSIGEIPAPAGYHRIALAPGNFGQYLRNTKLKKGQKKVHLYNGSEKPYQGAQYAILALDVGDKDLQQCADATMRLWAEYLFKQKRYKDIHFNFVSDGKLRYFENFADGDRSYPVFHQYLEWVFTYANTASLYDELRTVHREKMRPGDIFIQKGNPFGHAVIVVDMAEDKQSGKKVFLVAQSFMPAQEIHILNNPQDAALSPWYTSDFGDSLVTPEYTFSAKKQYRIKRFGKGS